MRTKKAADEVESKRNSSAGRRRRKAVDADAMVETKEKNDLDAPESRVSWDQFSFVFTSTPERASADGTNREEKQPERNANERLNKYLWIIRLPVPKIPLPPELVRYGTYSD